MGGLRAFGHGLRRGARHWPVIALTALVALLIAALAAAPAAIALLDPGEAVGPVYSVQASVGSVYRWGPIAGRGSVYRPSFSEVLYGVDGWMMIEAFPAAGASGDQSQRRVARLVLAAGGILVSLSWLSSAFLGGGVLSAYADEGGLRWARFLRESWRWFGTLLLMGVLRGGVTVSVLVLAGAVVGAAGMGAAWFVAPVLAVMWVFVLAVGELGRVEVVVGGRRNVLRALGEGVRFVLRRPLGVTVLYGVSLVSWVVAYVLYRWVLVPRLPPAWWALAFVLQQGFVVLWLWIRLGRWAGVVALVRS